MNPRTTPKNERDLSSQAAPPRGLTWGVFAILFFSFAFFWHSRDWNTASRLMLTYALGDRGTISLDGLNVHTNDLAKFQGHYYSDKQPGFSFLGLGPYLAAKSVLWLPPHPVDAPRAMTHWPADYWVTLLTSSLVTAWCGVLLVTAAYSLGCGPRRAALVGLAYGLSTHASVYATLAYGHQTAATFLLAATLLVALVNTNWRWAALGAGFFASFASTVELSVAPVSALVALLCLVRVAMRKWPSRALVLFTLGAAGPLMFLLAYNQFAFGSPFDMGYAHHVVERFRAVHGQGNAFGLTAPRWDRAAPLLFSEYRGLFVYAPIVILAPLGWVLGRWTGFNLLRFASISACVAVFLVNLSYPEWTGGWCTGPRLLVPLLPSAMLGVAALLAGELSQIRRCLVAAAGLLALAGFCVNLACQGIDARIPDALGPEPVDRPLSQVVAPLWTGQELPPWREGQRFGRNLVNLAAPWVNDNSRLAPDRHWAQFIPLLLFQAVGVGALFLWPWSNKCGRGPSSESA